MFREWRLIGVGIKYVPKFVLRENNTNLSIVDDAWFCHEVNGLPSVATGDNIVQG